MGYTVGSRALDLKSSSSEQLSSFPARWTKYMPSRSKLDYICVKINGKRYEALLDNQASLNIMSVEFARKSGLAIRKDEITFVLTDGSVCNAIGRVSIHYHVAKASRSSPSFEGTQEFYVLPRVIRPLILGSPFLEETRFSLEANCSVWTPLKAIPTVENPESSDFRYWASATSYGKTFLKLYLTTGNATEEVMAMPDQGSNSNMMSWLHAKSAGYQIDRRRSSQIIITLGNGHTIRSSGLVWTTVRFSRDTPIVDGILCKFAVIPGLLVDIILSNRFLRKHHVAAIRSQLEWIRVEEKVPGFHAGYKKRKTLWGNEYHPQNHNSDDQKMIDEALKKGSKGDPAITRPGYSSPGSQQLNNSQLPVGSGPSGTNNTVLNTERTLPTPPRSNPSSIEDSHPSRRVMSPPTGDETVNIHPERHLFKLFHSLSSAPKEKDKKGKGRDLEARGG